MASNVSSDVTEANELLQRLKVEWEWLQATLRPSFNAIIVDSASDMECFDLQSVSGDIHLTASSYFRQVVFTHMDCQSLNILTPCEGFHLDDELSDAASDLKNDDNVQEVESKPEEDDQEEEMGRKYASVRLIDFEYAGVNPRAADIANTFSEYCNMNNLEPEYESQYPTGKQQDVFLRAYIETASPELAKQLDQFEDGWTSFLAAARVEIGQHTLLSHIGWGIWAIAQESLSNIEFDYLKYARLRLEGYFHFKDRYFRGDDEPVERV
jgi:ethanolamine kinase